MRRDKVPGKKKTGSGGKRPGWARLLPELLKTSGYRSNHSGKWHLEGMPLQTGFDRSHYLKDQGRFFNSQIHYQDHTKLPAVELGCDFYGTTANHAVRLLQEHAKDLAEQPFFHYLAFTAQHSQLHALPEDIACYQNRYKDGWDVIRKERWQRMQALGLLCGLPLSSVNRSLGPPHHFPVALTTLGEGEINRPLAWESLTASQQQFQGTKMTLHAAMIDSMDREIGRVLDQLRVIDAFGGTLILFLSDNGVSAEIMVRSYSHDPLAAPGSAPSYLCLGAAWSTTCNTPFSRHKTWLHEGGTATPLIAHWPKGFAARGEFRDQPGHVIDFVPTILAITGTQAPKAAASQPQHPGLSLMQLWKELQTTTDSSFGVTKITASPASATGNLLPTKTTPENFIT